MNIYLSVNPFAPFIFTKIKSANIFPPSQSSLSPTNGRLPPTTSSGADYEQPTSTTSIVDFSPFLFAPKNLKSPNLSLHLHLPSPPTDLRPPPITGRSANPTTKHWWHNNPISGDHENA
jgi:hypothetical protein